MVGKMEADINAGHKHCTTCYTITRCNRSSSTSDESCDMKKCINNCGAMFHGCKMEDHLELCPNSTIACINRSLGCPISVLRRDISRHLIHCPASVVVCMAEWNRWPVYTVQRRKHIPFKQSNPYGQPGKIDFVRYVDAVCNRFPSNQDN